MTVFCDTCGDQSLHDPLRDFRASSRIFLADVDGVTWASDSYWAVPVPNAQHQIARLFHSYNLEMLPGTYPISDTLARLEPPMVSDIKAMVLDKVPADMVKVSPVQLHGADAYVKGTYDDQWLAVYDIPGGLAVLDDEKRRMTERMAPEGEWWASSNPKAMFVRQTDDGAITAVLMPLRHKVSER